MNRTPREEREAAEAEWLHENRETLREDAESAEEVDFEVARPLAVTTSFRLSPDEAETIRQAARTSGLSQSEWIRAVCIAAANQERPAVTGISAPEARKLRGLLEQAEQIVGPATPGELNPAPGGGSLLGVRYKRAAATRPVVTTCAM